tara:strand:+ start:504 stop:1073 length:570 start_codon:yes stop_codon:yes gene_type:complete
MINIIGGKFKKTKLEVPLKKVRPTSIIKRKAIFSILESYGMQNSIDIYYKKSVIDLFAGSGALGLEAISRGAYYCYFFDTAKEVCDTLYKNCKKIIKENKFNIQKKDSREIKKILLKYPLSLVFIDPPYNLYSINDILINLLEKNIFEKNTIIVIETSNKEKVNFKKNFILIKEKKYNKTNILFLKKLG